MIDPKRIAIADHAEMYLKIRPGTDGALAMAMMHVIINEKLYDADFIRKMDHLDSISWCPMCSLIPPNGRKK